MRNDRAGSAMSGKKSKSKPRKKKGGKPVHEMHIRHAKSGGYIVKHHFKPQPGGSGGDMPQEPEEHAVPDMDSLQQHVGDNMQPQAMQSQPQQPAPQMG